MSFGSLSQILCGGRKELMAEETFGEFRFGVGGGLNKTGWQMDRQTHKQRNVQTQSPGELW